jgi:hypothetical protein
LGFLRQGHAFRALKRRVAREDAKIREGAKRRLRVARTLHSRLSFLRGFA